MNEFCHVEITRALYELMVIEANMSVELDTKIKKDIDNIKSRAVK